MPILPNPKHEMFAQALAKGASATDAYAEAGYAKATSNAARLIANDSIQARVEEIRGRAAVGLNVTQQWFIERAEEARQGAMVAGQHSAAVAAIKEIGTLTGLRVEKQQTSNVVYTISDEPLTMDQWEAKFGEPVKH